jgi:hypothetical protein
VAPSFPSQIRNSELAVDLFLFLSNSSFNNNDNNSNKNNYYYYYTTVTTTMTTTTTNNNKQRTTTTTTNNFPFGLTIAVGFFNWHTAQDALAGTRLVAHAVCVFSLSIFPFLFIFF